MKCGIAMLFGVSALGSVSPTADADCTCAKARLLNTWCKSCKVGYVAGIKIESELLYEELDPHGHDIDPERIQCTFCRKALETDGFCERCRIGFVNKQAYLSTLAYRIAQGTPQQPSAIRCKACKRNSHKYGWCALCKRGMVGPVAMDNKNTFDRAVQAYELVLAAIRTLDTCTICAVAMITDGYCPRCKVSFKEGQRAVKDSVGPARGKKSTDHTDD